jgi:lysophospholipase L1-like esterase
MYKLAQLKPAFFPKLLLALVVSLLTLALAEYLLRLKYPADNNYYVWYPNVVARFNTDSNIIHGVSPHSRFTINNIGVRGDKLPFINVHKVLCVGGSTTECLYLDDKLTWPALLQNKLGKKNWVGNIGKSGTKSVEHYIQIKYATSNLHPDYLLCTVGLNDMLRYLTFGNLPAVKHINEETFKDSCLQTINLKSDNAFKRLALYRLVRNAYRTIFPYKATDYLAQDKEGKTIARWRSNRLNAAIIDTVPNLESTLLIYESNLQGMIDEAKKKGYEITFVQQCALWKDNMSNDEMKLLWMGGTGNFQKEAGHSYYSPRVLNTCLQQFNLITEKVCTQNGIPFFKLDIPKTGLFFYDDCHFTNKGADAVAEQIYRQWKITPAP